MIDSSYHQFSDLTAYQLDQDSGSVVECLTWEQGGAGLSLTGITALCPWARTLILALYWFNPQEDLSLYNWKIIDGT